MAEIPTASRQKEVEGHLFGISARYGIIGGVLITLYCFLLHAIDVGNDYVMLFRYLKFAILFFVIMAALNNYKRNYRDRFKFARGMIIGTGVSFTAALVVTMVALVALALNNDYVLDPFIESQQLSPIGVAFLTFFEIAIIGGVILNLGLMLLFQRRPEKINEE